MTGAQVLMDVSSSWVLALRTLFLLTLRVTAGGFFDSSNLLRKGDQTRVGCEVTSVTRPSVGPSWPDRSTVPFP